MTGQTRQPPPLAAACGVAGACAGALDGSLGGGGGGGELCFHVATMGAAAGALGGAFLSGIAMALSRHPVARRLMRDGPLLLGALLPGAAWAYASHRALSLDAIEPRHWWLLATFCCVTLLLAQLLRTPRWTRRPGRGLALTGATMAAALWLSATGLVERPELVGTTLRSSVVGGSVLALLRGSPALDADGDRFPSALCAGDCDCDDHDGARNPGAVDIPGDGVDQDCDGADAHAGLEGAPAAGERSEGNEANWSDGLDELLPVPAEEEATTGSRLPDLLLITVDTLRADHLGAYGYGRDTSPRIDRLAAEGTLFERNYSQGPMTAWSISSMVTGRYFTELDRTAGKWPRVRGPGKLLGERMSAAGYHTAGFAPQFFFRRRYGAGLGFKHWDTAVVGLRHPFRHHVTGDVLTDRAIAHMQTMPTDRPVLLWVHYGDPHSDYLRHPEFSRFGRDRKGLYDGEIRFTDHQIARLLDAWRALRRTRPSIGILTADHGEDLVRSEDHGSLYHGSHLHDSLTRVPLIAWGDGVLARRVSTPTAVLDILPTMTSLAGLPLDPSLRGQSLLPWLRGEDPPHNPVFSEKPTPAHRAMKSMVDWPHKLIWHKALNLYSLYDLQTDPAEAHDVFGLDPNRDARLVERMVRWRSRVLQERAPVPARLLARR
jgi:choline-sulfatase